MKLIHLSDLHLGKRVNEFSMLEDQEYILQEILQIVDEEKPDGVMIAGDIYDKAVPPAEAVELFDNFLSELSARHLQTFVISGNHDSAERIAFGSRLMEGSGVHMSPVYNGTVRPVTMHDAYGDIDIWMLPFIRPASVRQFYGKKEEPAVKEDAKEAAGEDTKEQEETSSGLHAAQKEDHRADTYESAMRIALSHLPLDHSRRNILITHQFVTGASRTDSEEKSLGGTDNISADVFVGFDYVALGHIHRAQNMSLGRKPSCPMIRYSGSPLKYSFSESKDEKSVTVLDFTGAKTTGASPSDYIHIHTVPLVPVRDMREIKGTYADLTLRSNYEGTAVDDYLHITLTDEQPVPDAARRLQTIYHHLMRQDYDNTRTRNESHLLEQTAILTRTPMELMDAFYKEQNGRGLEDTQRTYLQGLLAALFGK